MNIIQRSSPNYYAGRRGYKPIAIVNHITAGPFPGCLTWLCNPESQGGSHYLVNRVGEVYQLVAEENSAWANGIVQKPFWPLLISGVNPNYYTLSIEHEGQPYEPLTEKQYQATLELHMHLCKKWNIPLDRQHILGHYEIDSVDRPNCPGMFFPWQRLISDLNAAANRVTVYLNGVRTEHDGLLIDGKTYVPVRFFAQELGCDVNWESTTQSVNIKK